MSDSSITVKRRWYEDAAGDVSSKRVIGAALVASGGVLLAAVGVASIFRAIGDPDTALGAGKALITAGAALIGAGVLDGVGERIGGAK